MKLVYIARVLLGLPLVVFGLNGLLHFMEPPGELPAAATAFMTALEESHYLVPLKSAIEVGSGVMILTGLFLPLGLVLFAPILVNIVAFHVFLEDPMNGVVGYLMLACELYLAWAYRSHFAGVLAPFAKAARSK